MVVVTMEHLEYGNEEGDKLDSVMIPIIVGQLPEDRARHRRRVCQSGGPYPACCHSTQGI